MNKKNQAQEITSKEQVLLHNLTNSVFSRNGKEILIGGEKIKPELRSVLKEQAFYLSTSQLWEIMTDTIRKESSDLALNNSTEWDHVLYAKALKYWGDVFIIMVDALKN